MAYFVPGENFKSGKPLGVSYGLSTGDRQGIARMYPGRTPPRDQRPVFMYFTKKKKTLSVKVKNGLLRIFVNNQPVIQLDSRKSPYIGKVYKVNVDRYFRNDQPNLIRFEFKKLSSDWYHSLVSSEGGKYFYTYYCDPKYYCDKPGGLREGFYYVHISQRNRGKKKKPVHKPVRIDPSLSQELLQNIYEGNTGKVMDLLARGADPNARLRGWTALMYAAYFGHDRIVLELLRRHADRSPRIRGFKAIDLARAQGHQKIVRMFEAAAGRRNVIRVKHRRMVPRPRRLR